MATNRHSTDLMMDEWLDNQGFYRKHTAKDGSCLFRAVSEQVFKTQAFHLNVRQSCINYMERNRKKFEKLDINGSFDDHISNLQNPKEAASQIDIDAMSLLFKCDFLSFHEIGKPAFKLTDNMFDKKVMLYVSESNHYDSIFSKSFVANAAFCQSIAYEILYKEVYEIGDEVDFAVEKMLHDKVYAKLRKDSTTSMDSNCVISPDFVLDQEEESWDDKEIVSDVRRALAQGYPPFPYKVAKALDSEIYRNVEFDVWNDTHKDEMKFEPGVKCLVRLDKDKEESYHAHIQEITPDKGPVTVYIVELGEKRTVPYESLESFPSSFRAGWQSPFGKNYKTMSTYYHKPHMNGNIIEIDKARKKMCKKGKFKDVSYSLPSLPRGQSLPPRLQSQFDSSILPLGRGRNTGPFHGVGRNPSPHVKWISPQNQRYHYNRNNNNGNRYMYSNVGMNGHANNNNNGCGNHYNNRVYNKGSYEPSQRNNGTSKQNYSSSMPTSTSVTWAKSIGTVSQMQSQVNSFESGTNDNGSQSSVSQSNSTDREVPPPTTVPTNVPSLVPASYSSSTTAYTSSQATPSMSFPSCSMNVGSIPALVPSSSPTPMTPNSSQPSYESSPPQPVAVYPYQCYTGVCIPYEPPIHPINYSIARSQDPNGMDLPFQDLATLRFFFNLGCDYFRVSSITQVPSSPPPYTVWNYGPTQVGYSQSMNGYLTPVSNSDPCDIVDDSLGSAGGTTAAPSPEQSEGDYGTPVEELYEAAYVYSSPPLGFVPGLWAQPIDYTSPPMQGVQNGLVMNDQGILSLSPTPCYPLQQSFSVAPSTTNSLQGPPRHRSDSGSSGRSQKGINIDPNRGNYTINSRSKPKPSNSYSFEYQNNGCGGNRASSSSQQGSYNRQFSPRGNPQNNLPPRFQQQRLNPQPNRQQSGSYMGQQMMQMGISASTTPSSQATTPQFPMGSSILTASPTSIGLYSGGSPVSQGTLFATPTYYSPPHHQHPPPPPSQQSSQPATIVYSPTNPQTIPYLPHSAQ